MPPGKQQHQPQTITRTRQDLINSGELFRVNDKKYPDDKHQNARKGLTECCYSTSNLFLIVATIVALIVLIRFFQDQPLADYYEYLLTLSFYRQMIYVLVLMPFVLLVPIFNALSAVLSMDRQKSSSNPKQATSFSKALLKVKLFYEAILILLVFLALIFVAPNVKSINLSSQIELELRKFMRNRYVSEFAYTLLDQIQEHYQCCDHMWYRANLRDQLPLSCFVPSTGFSVFYERTCGEVLSSLIGTRCYIIAGCLIVILIALACLFSIDFVESLAKASGHYEIHRDSSAPQSHRRLSSTSSSKEELARDSDLSGAQKLLSNSDRDSLSESLHREPSFVERLKLEERERDTLLSVSSASHHDGAHLRGHSPARHQTRTTFGTNRPARFVPEDRPLSPGATSQNSDALDPCQPPTGSTEPVLLTRANYQLVRRDRSQSPVFVSPSPEVSHSGELAEEPVGRDSRAVASGQRPIKSALKKTTSNSSNIDNHDTGSPARFGIDDYRAQTRLEEDVSSDDDYTERLRQSDSLLRQKQLQREQQTRRSLLSVRFADE